MSDEIVVWFCEDCSSPCTLESEVNKEAMTSPRLCPFNHNMAKWKRKTE